MTRRPAGSRSLAPVLMTASGFAGLGYQVVWIGQVGPWLGHEAAAVLAVLTAFFAGLALGAFAFGPAIERSTRPLRWYVACECVIGTWALVLVLAMDPFGAAVMDATGVAPTPWRQWSIAFAATFLVLLPATAAMGATLPAIERAMAASRLTGRSISTAYAFNTLGAMSGVLGATFWLIPALGLARAAAACAAVNLACAISAPFVLPVRGVVERTASIETGATRTLFLLAATGFLGVGFEVLVVRVLSQVTEDTVYTYALLLAVYLCGTTAGAAAGRRFSNSVPDTGIRVERLTVLLAMTCLVGTATLWSVSDLHDLLRAHLPMTFGSAVLVEALLAVAVFAPATFLMGMLFTALADRACAAGAGFGRAIGWNTIGAACAPCVFGVLLVPAVGPKAALLLLVAAYLFIVGRRAATRLTPWVVAAGIAAVAVIAPPLAFVDVPEGGQVVHYEDGVTASVSVVEDADGIDRLRIDNRQQEGTSASGIVDGRQALLPLLLHPAPKRALFLGLGTGVTARTAARIDGLDVDAVELLPEVVHASSSFAASGGGRGPHIITADARRYVRAGGSGYDVIVADNFHPARSGSGALYTVEHFRAIDHRLSPGGLFCQWLPLHQLDPATLRSIVASFIAVYPDGFAILANNSLDTPVIGLVARRQAGLLDPAVIGSRIAQDQSRLASYGLDDAFAVLGSIVAGPASLGRFADGAPVNRDDRPVVTYLAPRATYAPEASSRQRLMDFLRAVRVESGEVVDGEPEFVARLAAYRTARDQFIVAGAAARPTNDVVDMLAQVRAPLLSVLRTSPDFRPAYDPLLRMAVALRDVDGAAADDLLADLARVRPAPAGSDTNGPTSIAQKRIGEK